jgi:ABC-type glycerol-3-phosphate transport system substrate-binding protein
MDALQRSVQIGRRTAMGALAAGAAAFALFGPRGAKESAGRRIVLDYWEKWTGHEARAMQEIVHRFNQSQDRILVRYIVTAGIDQKALVAIAGGDPPDVVGLWSYNVPAFAEASAILPLDDLGAPFGVHPDIYSAGVRQVALHEGKFWAAINTGGSVAMYYNRELFRQAGLDPDHPPRTIAELDHDSVALTSTQAGRILRTGFLHSEPGWWCWVWGYPFGGTLYDPTSDRSLIASPENIAGYEWVQSYPRRLGPAAEQQFRAGFGNYDSPLNAFLSGKVGIILQGPWLANVINAYKPGLDYGVAPFPVIDSLYDPAAPIALIDTDILVIPRGVKHPQASMEFIAFTQRQDNVEFLSTVHCKASPLAASSEAFLANHPNRGVRIFDALAKSPRTFVCPRTRTWLQLREDFEATMQDLWTLRRAAPAALTDLQSRAQALLDRAADQRRRRAALRGGRGGGGGA